MSNSVLLDATKISTYQQCPRLYFYNYELGWRSDKSNIHLVFGGAWHKAMESLYANDGWDVEGDIEGCIERAQNDFVEYFNSRPIDFMPKRNVKTLENGVAGVEKYAHNFLKRDIATYNILEFERGGTATIGSRTFSYRCDVVLQDKSSGRIVVVDFKSGGSKQPFDWKDRWQFSTQMAIYRAAMAQKYQHHDVWSLIRGAWFSGTKQAAFGECWIPPEFDKRTEMKLESWYQRVEDDRLKLLDDNGECMQSFPMNDQSCFNYNRKCEFFDQCGDWSNPNNHKEEVPDGYSVRHWNPLN